MKYEGGLAEMKSFMSAKGIIVLALLTIVALGSGTALASNQGSTASQTATVRVDGAEISPLTNCTNNNSDFTIWGSGFGSNEMVIISVIKDADTAIIWSTGNANAAGTINITKSLVTKPPSATSDKARWPGEGLLTVEALSVRGRLATAPVLFTKGNCPGTGLLSNYPLP
jgi:hypothetical protein